VSDGKRARIRAGLAQALAFARSAEPRPEVPRRAVAADIVLAAAASVAALAAAPASAGALEPVLVVLTAAPLALRRVFPLTAFWAIMAAIIVLYYSSSNSSGTIVVFLVIGFAAYSAVVHSRYRGAALLSMPLVTALTIALFPDTSAPVPGRATPLLIFIPLMIVGNAVHLWARRAGDSKARLRRAEAEHNAATRRALKLERARIASELHDVVTHNVSVMVVQAGAARQVLGAEQDEARSALLAVEASGRTAMAELQHMLGLLSVPGEPEPGAPADGDLRPLPGLDQLMTLTDQMAAAGLDVDLRVDGAPRALPPGQDLAAYRVIQEGLTNVLKHAGTARTVITLDYRPGGLRVQVADDGPPSPAAGPAAGPPGRPGEPAHRGGPGRPAALPGTGRGLLGLRERVALHGGEFDAGPRPGGGWCVMARFPAEQPPPAGPGANGTPAARWAAAATGAVGLPGQPPS
jgi:signal transduction histidine kinase